MSDKNKLIRYWTGEFFRIKRNNLRNISKNIFNIENQYCVKTQKYEILSICKYTFFLFSFSNRVTEVCVNDWPASQNVIKEVYFGRLFAEIYSTAFQYLEDW